MLCVLGRGNSGKVFLVRCRGDGNVYAMKVLKKRHIIDHGELKRTRTEKKVTIRSRSLSCLGAGQSQ